jgi:hypothetical protein
MTHTVTATARRISRFKDGMFPSDFFRGNVVLSFQEDALGIRLRSANYSGACQRE